MDYCKRSYLAGALRVAVTVSLIGVPALYLARPSAAEEFWSVVETEGAAETLEENVRRNAATGFVLRGNSAAVTSASGHVTLRRGADTIRLSHSSHIEISADASEDGVWQRLGRVLFNIESQEFRNFEIDTPLMVFVIKGTTFSVTVEPGRERISVIEGAVQVTVRKSGDTALVGGGQTATVTRGDGRIVLTGISDPGIFQDIHEADEPNSDAGGDNSNDGGKNNPPDRTAPGKGAGGPVK